MAADVPLSTAIFGAGAVGGHLAVRLAQAGHDVTAITRGPALEAIRSRGLSLRVGEEVHRVDVKAVSTAAEAGPQELVIVSVKSTGMGADFGAGLGPLLKRGTKVLFVANGLPWWYFEKAGGNPPPRLPLYAAASAIMRDLAGAAVLGGIIYSANSVTAPGEIVNNSPGRNRMHFAAVTGGTDAAAAVSRAFDKTVFDAEGQGDVLEEVWRKLVITMCTPPLCIATGSLPPEILVRPSLRESFSRGVAEAHAIARSQGYLLSATFYPEAMLAAMPSHTPSMMADFLAGRPMEVESTLSAPLALGHAAGVPTPVLSELHSIVTARAAQG